MNETDKAQIERLHQTLIDRFPAAFPADEQAIRPLKIGIHEDLAAVLDGAVEVELVRRFLGWYVHRPVYWKATVEAEARIDLAGNPAGPIKKGARRWTKLRLEGKSEAKKKAVPTPPIVKPDPETLYAMAIDARMEVTLRFTELPQAQPMGQGKMTFALKADDQYVLVEIKHRMWNKLRKADEDWPAWIAALIGVVGERTDKGFRLQNYSGPRKLDRWLR